MQNTVKMKPMDRNEFGYLVWAITELYKKAQIEDSYYEFDEATLIIIKDCTQYLAWLIDDAMSYSDLYKAIR